MLFLLAAVFGTATQAQAQTPPTCGTNSIWCATLTLGSGVSGAETRFGASYFDDTPNPSFNGGVVTYGVGHTESITFAPGHTREFQHVENDNADGGTLKFRFIGDTPTWLNTPANRDSLRLLVGDDTFAFSEDSWDWRFSTLTWTPSGITTWAAGNHVTVSIERRDPTDDATLSALSLAEGNNTISLSPAFDWDTDSYTATVLYSVETITVTATKNTSAATVTISPDDDGAGVEGHQIDLDVGSNAITVTVAHGSTTGTYTVTVTRASELPPPTCGTNSIWCATLTLGSGVTGAETRFGAGYFDNTPTPFFNGGVVTYGVGHTESITFEPGHTRQFQHVENDNADGGTLKFRFIGGTPTWLNTPANRDSLRLLVGDDTFDFSEESWDWRFSTLTWAPSGITTWATGDHVTVSIEREVDDTTLSGLTVENEFGHAVSLTPNFVAGTTSYSASVSNAVKTITVTATKNTSAATVTISPTDASTDAGHQVGLSVGSNAITVTVTHGSTTGTYTVTVTRAAAPPPLTCGTDSIWCATLTLGSTTTGAVTRFGAGYFDDSSDPDFNGGIVTYGTGHDHYVNFSTNTAEDGELHRVSNDNAGGGTLTFRFQHGTAAWLNTEANRNSLSLRVGSDTFDFENATWVYDMDHETLTWSNSGITTWAVGNFVTVSIETKAVGDDATLSALSLAEGSNPVSLSPAFSSSTDSYTASVPFRVKVIEVTATKNHADATVTISPGDDYGAPDGHQLFLDVGSNAITVTVTHGSTTGAYTVTVTRQSGSDLSSPTCVSDSIWCATLAAGSSSTMPTLFGWRYGNGLVNDEVTFGVGHSTRSVTFAGSSNTGDVHEFDNDNAGGGELRLSFTTGTTWLDATTNRATLNLQVGEEIFDFADADWDSTDKILSWSNTGLDWSAGDEITIHIVEKGDSNTAAAGSVTIPGIPNGPQHGLTLAADTSGITDADGLASPGYTYQWIRVGTPDVNIAGATASTYTVTADDVDKQLKVKVDFTDDAGNPETKTSADTAAVVAQSVISFNNATYSATEGGFASLTLSLTPYARASGTVTIMSEGQDGATASDYTLTRGGAVITEIQFTRGGISGDFHVNALNDTANDDGESVKITLGTLPSWMTAGSPDEAVVNLVDTDIPSVTVQFGSATYTAAEGSSVAVAVTLSDDPERTVVIPITVANQNGATSADYSGVPSSVTFTSGQMSRTFTVTAAQDTVDDDGESVKLTFDTLPTGVTAGTRDEAVVSLTDNDDPVVSVEFGASSYTVGEGDGVAVTVTLSADPERSLTIGLTKTNQGNAVDADYSGVPTSLTFDAGELGMTFTVTATQDAADDDDESVKLTFGTLPTGVNAGTRDEATVLITDDDDPAVSVQFGASSYTVGEGDGVAVTVSLSADPERTVTIGLTKTNQGDATSVDYSGVPSSVTLTSGQTSATFTVMATQDTLDDDGESVKLTFDTLPTGVSAGTRDETVVNLTDDDDPAVTVEFGAATYTAVEGGTATVTVTLSADPERTVTIAITKANQGGATSADYTVPSSVTLTSGQTSATFTVAATQDTLDDDDESVKLTFGSLPTGVTAGTRDEAVVSLTDDDDPAVSVQFGAATYAAAEGSSVAVTVSLSADPERTVTIALTASNQGGASSSDYSGVPSSVTLTSGQTSATFTVAVAQDTVDDDDESVKLTFGSLPTGVSAGTRDETVVNLTDDDDPAVSVQFGSATYAAAEGSSVAVTVDLSADPERTVTIALTAANQGGASSSDYSGVPSNVTLTSGQTSATFTVTVAQDTVDDDDESVKLTFGSLPTRVTAGTRDEAVVSLTDDDDPAVTVEFGAATYAAAEGSGVAVTVSLSADPERTVAIAITAVNQGTATSADYTVPSSVTLTSGQTSATFTVTATQDTLDDDDESVKLTFGALPTGVSAGSRDEAVVNLTDDDDPAVSVQFGSATYAAAEGSSVAVTVTLSADPERTVTIAITKANQNGAANADYSGVPSSVTLTSGQTSATFTVTVAQDTVDDDGESVKLTFGTLPTGVTAGTRNETVVSLTDDDDPAVTVQFGSATYAAAEGSSVAVTVTLSDDPERTVVIPITASNQGDATSSDYSGVPSSVTFTSGQTSTTFTVMATQDAVDDDGESVRLTFGTLPTEVTAGTRDEAVVSLTDNDDPVVSVQFGASSYMAAEGGTATVTVTLSADPERTVAIAITAVNQGTATSADYSGVPSSVTLTSGQTSATFMVAATQDTVDDDDESVKLTFGSLPTGVNAGTRDEAVVSLTDDDDPAVTVQFGASSYTVGEGDGVAVTVSLSADPERTVTIGLTKTNQGDATSVDYSGVPSSVTLTSGQTSATFTVMATQDTLDDDGESVKLTFDTLPTGVTAGTRDETVVNLTDDDDPAVSVQFGASSYTAAEGGTATVTVTLSADPERTVTIAITKANQGTATSADYTVPSSVTFTSGQTSATFTVAATQDTVDDDDESVKLTFGALPTGVTAGTRDETVVNLADDDDPAVSVQFGASSYMAAEGGTATVTVTLSADPERTVTIAITKANQGTATSADYTVPSSVTFTSGQTSATFTVAATQDTLDDDGESVKLTFGALPTGVSAGTRDEAVVSLTDDDDPAVSVRFGSATYAAAEGSSVAVTVTLSADPERTVTIALTAANQGGASSSDYSGVPSNVTLTSGQTSATFTVTVAQDAMDDDGESVKLTFGTLPTGVTAGTRDEAVVSLTDDDDPAVTVEFGSATYTAGEGASATVTVTLSADPERTVTIALTASNQGGASSSDYSGVPSSVTLTSGQTSATFTVTVAQDTVDDDGESVKLTFGSLPTRVTAGTRDETVVSLTDDDDPAVTVQFGSATYAAAEGSGVAVTVTLSADAERTVTIGLTKTNQGDATSVDYSGVPSSVTLTSGQTSATFTVTATQDTLDDDGESVKLTFGSLPTGVSAGTRDEAVVSLTDDDDPAVTVQFGSATYAATEGLSVAVTVSLSADPERTVTIALTAANQFGASSSDYSGVPSSVTLTSGQTNATFTVTVAQDTVDDDGESVKLTFGTLPTRVTTGTRDETVVSFTDDDDPAVSVQFGAAAYTAAEGSSVAVTVSLSADPERTVTIALTASNQGGASSSDYSGVPSNVTLTSGQTSATFTVTATQDAVDDDGESVKLTFGSLPTRVTAGTRDEAVVSLTDNDDPVVSVQFGASSYTAAEGGTATVTVTLSADPERTVTIALTAANQDGASSSDYSGVPASLTFDAGELGMTFTVTATQDTVDDDGESVKLLFGILPTGVNAGTRGETVVSLTDDDDPAVTVQFGSATYAAAEGSSVAVTVDLSADPERTVTIALTAANQGGASSSDYSGVPANVTLTSGQTSATFTVTAAQDTVDDDDESVKLTFGTLPTGVTAGTRDEAVVSLTDDDDPAVTVEFGAATYTAAEGASATVTVTLSADPERTVAIAITAVNQGTATSADYTVPSSVTFTSGQTSATFTVMATDDTLDDDGESVKLTFGSLPTGVTAGTRDETVVSLTDNDDPAVTVEFGAATYTAAEGASATVTVTLSADPERTVTIALTAANQGGASSSDYSGVPSSVTLTSGQTSATFTVMATQDTLDDDGESVKLTFDTLPTGVNAGTRDETVVNLTDDDDPVVSVQFGAAAYAAVEGSGVAVTVTLSADPERTVTIALTAANQGGASSSDYSGVPSNMTLTSGQTSATFTVMATQDTLDDDDESVKLTFGTLPTRVTAGTRDEAVVSLTDDDDPAVTVEFGAATYTAAEGASATVTVTLSADPERTVAIAITTVNQGTATSADYTVPSSVTFTSGQTSATFTVAATDDTLDDDGESVKLGFSNSLPAGVTAGTRDEATVSITDNDDPGVTVQFGAATYTAAEGGTATVTVTLSADPERMVTIALTAANQGGASSSDYSGVPSSVTLTSGQTSATFTVTVAQDTLDDDDESVKLTFGSLPTGVSAGTRDETVVSLTDDDDPVVTVRFGSATYAAAEGSSVAVTVTLSADPERTVTIALTASNQGGASAADYSGVPSNVTLTSGQTSATFTVTAAQDAMDDDGESVKLTFGTLPTGVTAGTRDEAVVSLTDDDDPAVAVEFGAAAYTAAEGSGVAVTVSLSADPERTVTIALTVSNQGGASSSDYTVPSSVTFTSGQTSAAFTVTAAQDAVDDDGESVKLTFGSLPTRVTAGTRDEAVVSLADNDDPVVSVQFGASSYMAAEGGTAVVTVTLSADPERTVTIGLTKANQGGASSSDYSGVPSNVTLTSGQTSATFTVTAAQDTVDDDGESVKLTFDTLPTGVNAGTRDETVVNLTDDDDPVVSVQFGAATYAAAEGSGVAVTVTLSADPERTVTIALTAVNQGGASSSDYSGVPSSVTLTSGQTSATFTVTVAQDTLDDDGESVKLTFDTLPTGVTAGTRDEAVVSLTDDDDPAVTVEFGAATYTAAEGGASATVTVTLSADPERTVAIAITAVNQGTATSADYTVPSSVTFTSGQTSATFTVTATQDTVDDDGESVRLGFSTSLPTGVTAGTRDETVVSLTDDDDPAVSVQFGSATYAAAEGSSVAVTVTLSADPERTVTIAITKANQGGASSSDYSGVPSSVTLTSGQTSATFTVTVAQDTLDDDDESVKLTFGTLPTRVTAGTRDETVVSLTDDDERGFVFDPTTGLAQEGSGANYTLKLSSEPTADVAVTFDANPRLTSRQARHLGLGGTLVSSVTFTPSNWNQAVSLVQAGTVEDANSVTERVLFGHTGSGGDYENYRQGYPVDLIDTDAPASGVLLRVNPETVDEGAGSTAVTVEAVLDGAVLGTATTVAVTLSEGTAVSADYTVSPATLTIVIVANAAQGSGTLMLTPTADMEVEVDETVTVSGTSALAVIAATVTIVDDDERGVTVTPTALALDEQDSGTYTVALDSAPTGSVTVTLSATGAAEASVRVSPGALVFTASDHGAKTVTVSARGDRDEAGGRVTVAHTVTGADYATETASAVTVDVTDTGIVEWDVQLSVDDVSLLAEGGGARTLTVTAELLTGVQTVAVPVSVTVTGETASASDFRASPASFTLTIPAGQAMASRPMTVTPTDDGIDEEDETLVVAPRVADHLTTNEAGVELTIADDDTRGVTVAPTVLELAEGAGGSYTVSLGSQPSGSVTVSVTLSGSASVTANRSSLVFTGSNWRSAQAVRVTAGQDADPDDESVTVTHGVTGADYDGEPAGSVQVTVTDDDKPSEAVRLSMTPDTVAEGAGASTLTVTGMLDASARVDAMEVELTIPAGDGYTAVGGTLTIAAGAVSGTARLTLTPEDDNADLADLPVTVEAATTAQATLAGGTTQPMRLEPGTLTVTIEDDDERGVTVTPTALTVAEGGSGEYTVVLRSEPDGSAVEVTLSLLDDDANAATDASVMPASLTFQPGAWSWAQTVTVTVVEDDAVEADATATITHAVLGADYGAETVPVVTVTVPGYEMMEDGGMQMLVSPSGLVMVPSGMSSLAGLSLALPVAHGGQTVTVRTMSMPGDEPRGFSLGDMVVDISGVELGSGETATMCLPVTEGGEESVQRWDEETMAWVELDEPPGGSPSGWVCGVTGQFSMFALMVRLEEPELVLSAKTLTVTTGEEEGATYTVALGLEPAGAVTVTVTGHEGTELSVAPATLVFTEGDWNVAQAVTATVSDEAEAGSEAVLTHTAVGGRYLGSWEKTLAVTVERDSGLLQRAREAWLARFGRTAAGHVAEAVAERLAAPAGQETQLALGGAQPRQALVAGVLQTLAGESRPDGRRMLADSAFVLALGSDGEQGWTAWGRGAYTEFDGEEDGLELDGEVASGTLGVDVERGDWRLGLALSHSEGEGEIREAEGDRYELESSLTGAYPYARWQLDETLSVWGVLGWGEGELEQERDGERTETDMEMRMAAFGLEGALGMIESEHGNFELSLKSDLLAVRVEADEDEDLPEVEADAQRVRLLLEGAGHCPLESGGVLAPTLEAGLRYDEGDAETGLGAELGAGLRYADGSGRLSAALNARGLLAHEESGYEEWGVSGSLRLEPDGSGRGLSLTLESALGVTGSGTDELWARRDLSGLARDDDFEAAGRFRAEMGLGLNAPGGLGTMTPYVGYERMDTKSVWHLGGRLKAGPDLAIGLEGSMHRGDGDSDRQELRLNLSGRW